MSVIRAEANSSSSGRSISRTGTAAIGAVTAALVSAVVLAPPAMAAKPNNQACLGHDVATYAEMGAGFGAFVSGLADGGAGREVQAHLAGLVPDEAVPNSCNDE